MKYIDWIDEFEKNLLSLSEEERAKAKCYYGEMYADMRDGGLSEEQAVAEFGAPYDAAKKILDEGVFGAQSGGGKIATFESNGPCDELDFNCSLCSINVEFYDGDSVKIDYPSLSPTVCEVTQSGGKITVRNNKKVKWKSFKALFGDEKMEYGISVKLPKDLTPDCRINLSAGKMTLGEGSYGKIEAQTDGGAFTARGITCGDIICATDAGALELKDITCHRLRAEVNAGRLTAEDLCGSVADIALNAGSADVKRADARRVNVKVSAGSAKLELCGGQSNYDVEVTKTLAKCDLKATDGGRERLLKADVSLGALTVNFL